MNISVVGTGYVGLVVGACLAETGNQVVGADVDGAKIEGLKHNLLPATLNYEEPDPRCPVRVHTHPRPVDKPHFLKVSCTELGQCAAVVCRKWEA